MRSQRLLSVSAMTVAAALAFVLDAVLFSAPATVRPPLDILYRVERGMSLADIERLIGAPPDDYRSGPVAPHPSGEGQSLYYEDDDEWLARGLPKHTWQADTIDLKFTFTRADRVATGSYQVVMRQDQGLLDNVLWRAKRLWHRWFP